MSSNSSQNAQKKKLLSPRVGFQLLVLASVSALILTFIISISAAEFSTKLIAFIGLTGIYLTLVSVIYTFQAPPDNISPAEIVTEKQEKAEEQIFSVEIEEKLLALEEVNTIFSSSLKPADMFRLVSNRINEIIPFLSSALYLANKNRDKLRIAYVFGSESSALSAIEIKSNAGIAGKAFQTGAVETDSDLSLEKSVFPIETLSSFKSAIACPLIYETEPYGVLALYNSENNYRQESEKLLEAIGARISPLFINSLTFEHNLNNSLNDSITDLPNERALFMMLENQVAESQRYREQRPLTVLSIDVKNFSELNNSYGHATGDRILRFVAKNVKEQLRQMDFLSRISGDEFLAVLPTSSDETTKMIVERINKTFAVNPFPVTEQEKIFISLSFGAASFIRDGETAQDLIKIAAVKKREAKSFVKSSVLWFPKEYSN